MEQGWSPLSPERSARRPRAASAPEGQQRACWGFGLRVDSAEGRVVPGCWGAGLHRGVGCGGLS
eukprot:11203621-Alexandrium_andersonii.AAC.1